MRTLFAGVWLLVAVVVGTAPGTATADRLVIPMDPPPANSPEGVLRPVRGMHMAQVLERFGEPLQRLAPVGDPPITRWVYERFIVYFEHDITLHAVVPPGR